MVSARAGWILAIACAAAVGACAWLALRQVAVPQLQHPVALPQPSPAAAPQPQLELKDSSAPVEQLTPLPKGAPPRTAQAVFEAKFEAARQAPKPPPNPAILSARSFEEAFRAMKEAEAQPAAEAAAINPFGNRR